MRVTVGLGAQEQVWVNQQLDASYLAYDAQVPRLWQRSSLIRVPKTGLVATRSNTSTQPKEEATMRTITALLGGAALCACAGLALAQEATDDGMEGMDHAGMAMDSPMGQMMGAMDAMMQAMPVESSGLVDADFLLMMIPHHQSAIDMARVELEQGQDEATRTMAQEIIDAQEAEIAEMRAMLEGMGVEPPATDAE